jgi:hypothetical protein
MVNCREPKLLKTNAGPLKLDRRQNFAPQRFELGNLESD